MNAATVSATCVETGKEMGQLKDQVCSRGNGAGQQVQEKFAYHYKINSCEICGVLLIYQVKLDTSLT